MGKGERCLKCNLILRWSLDSKNWDLIECHHQVWNIYLSSERINKYHTSTGFKNWDSNVLYLNLCHCKDPKLKLDYSIAIKSTVLFFHLFRGVVKIMLLCTGLNGAGFLSVTSNTRICYLNLWKLHPSIAHFHSTTGSHNGRGVKMFPLCRLFFLAINTRVFFLDFLS